MLSWVVASLFYQNLKSFEMKNKALTLLLLAALGFTACHSEPAPKEEPAAPAPAASEDAITIEVPSEFLVEINEKGEVKIMGESITPTDFEKKITEYFEGYRAAGAKAMPPIAIKIDGTVTMGIRNEFETIYNDTKTKFEGLH